MRKREDQLKTKGSYQLTPLDKLINLRYHDTNSGAISAQVKGVKYLSQLERLTVHHLLSFVNKLFDLLFHFLCCVLSTLIWIPTNICLIAAF